MFVCSLPYHQEITGIDLVEWQLRVAAGERLPVVHQDEIASVGHAFEARIYAEHPARGFLPATGTVWHHAPPPGAALNDGMARHAAGKVRVDTCIRSGLDVSVYYDPMISKLIVHGENRTVALRRLVQALQNYQIAGVPSNIGFLIKCAQHPTFQQAGAVNTGFLEDYADDVQVTEGSRPPPLAQVVGAFAALLHLEGRRGGVGVGGFGQVHGRSPPSHPWSSHQGSWRMGGSEGRATRVLELDLPPNESSNSSSSSSAGRTIKCTSNTDGSFDVQVATGVSGDENNDDCDDDADVEVENYHITGVFGTDTSMEVVVNHSHRIQVGTALKEDRDVIHICMWPKHLPGEDYMWEVRLKHPYAPSSTMESSEASSASGGGEGSVKAPMPGKISRLEKQVGDPVNKGDVVLVMEAMKMEHSIRAPVSGVVAEIRFKEGDIVGDGALLLVVGNEEEEAA